jgi:Cu(I)/Ag(I) efflux system membrane fusion protein
MRTTLLFAALASVIGTSTFAALHVHDSAQRAEAAAPRREPTVGVASSARQAMGIEVSPVSMDEGPHRVRAFGKVSADERRVYALISGVDGVIREVSRVTTGSVVRKGQLLATFASPDVVTPIQSYINAVNARQRIRNAADQDETVQGNVSAQQTLGTVQQTADRLRSLGMTDDQISDIERTRQLPATIRIVAPADGVVVAWQAAEGLRFGKGHEWYRIADLRSVWILADLPSGEALAVKPGMEGRVLLGGTTLSTAARVSDVRPQFDAATQRLTVRIEVDNPELGLRPDMLVDVEVLIPHPPALSVPVSAVIDRGLSKHVFVERADGSFESREVHTGWRSAGRVEIVHGLMPLERVVTAGAFFVEAEDRLRGLAPPEAAHGAHAHH